MASSYLGQPQAVRGETDIIDLSNSVVNSVFLCIRSLKSALWIRRYVWGRNILKHAPGSTDADRLLLTSTCIQMLYFLQMSEMAMRGSNAPCTVVPAVALTKKGTKPCTSTNKHDCTWGIQWCSYNSANMFACFFHHRCSFSWLNTIKPVLYVK